MPSKLLGTLAALALAAAGCAGDAATGSGVHVVSGGVSAPYAAAVELTRPYPELALAFIDTHGRPFDLAADTRAPVTLVFFGYTHCPDVCNTVLADAAVALKRAEPTVRERTQLVFVTTDPKRDRPEVIGEYLGRFDPSFVGLTAPMPTIERAAESMGVALTGTTALPEGGYDVGHSAQLVAFDAAGRGRLVWVADKISVGALRQDLTHFASLQPA